VAFQVELVAMLAFEDLRISVGKRKSASLNASPRQIKPH
jgi:hypothetical protein